VENRPASIACANSRDPPYIPIAKARGIAAAFDKKSFPFLLLVETKREAFAPPKES